MSSGANPRSRPETFRRSIRSASLRKERFSHSSRSLLDIESLSDSDIHSLLKEAGRFRESPRKSPLVRRHVALLFYEASTRTRCSFELAAKSLGATTTLVSSMASSIEKGESLVDTGATLAAMGAECIVIRHPSSGAPHVLARHLTVPIVNAGDGMHEHPSQALLDCFTILQHRRSLEGLRLLLVGDIFHSRVARSNALLLTRLGAQVTFCGPPALLPDVAETIAPSVRIMRDFNAALPTADVIMMLRVQKERLSGLQLSVDDYIRDYQLTSERMALAPADALVMHPGPMVRGMELTSEVADSARSLVLEQVRNGVAVRRAILLRALGGRA
ncbi:MAG TPA: aspartate carbamoyltransferase catalytic subunit [Terriglobales bacterium]|jgi:aspartate carbamoyltransferase catalytic subunit|nr:aspartate carbamoyltransferase catalytic subunit [Terriglobales bacterium]